VTTAPAASTDWSPTVTPSSTTTCDPIQTSSPMRMPRLVSGCWKNSTVVSLIEWLKPRIEVWAPMRTASPIRTSPRITV
jgi:hypothetical protein